ncbi:MAG: redoxin domain-containing protein [Candidatus Dormibacteria bacterium]
MRARLLAALVLAGALLVVVLARTQPEVPAAIHVSVASGSAQVGVAAPDFSSQRLDGAPVRLSHFRGKPVLLNFWATWCGACQDEMPLIERASERYAPIGLTVLAVDYRQTDGKSMAQFLNKVGAHFAALYDPNGRIAAAYGVNVGLPVSVFIDRAGTVSFIQLGQMSDSVLAARLNGIL